MNNTDWQRVALDWETVALNWRSIAIEMLTMDNEMLKKAREAILPIVNEECNTVNSQMAHIMSEEAITSQMAIIEEGGEK